MERVCAELDFVLSSFISMFALIESKGRKIKAYNNADSTFRSSDQYTWCNCIYSEKVVAIYLEINKLFNWNFAENLKLTDLVIAGI